MRPLMQFLKEGEAMKKLSIIYTSDIHARLFAAPGKAGLDYTSSCFPRDGNCLIIDGGDLLQGGPVGAFLSRYHEGANEAARIMNRCGYHAITLGNHDFNYGLEYLDGYLRELDAICLCANIKDKAGKLPIFDSRIFTMENGLRIGLFGLCTPSLSGWERVETLVELNIEPILTAGHRAMKSLQGCCDMTVCIYHGGFQGYSEACDEHQAELICRELKPDVLLTGHQHILESGKLIGGTFAVQPGSFGEFYSHIEIEYEQQTKINCSARLIPAPLMESEMAMNTAQEAFSLWEKEALCTLPDRVPVGDRVDAALNGSPLAELINRMQLKLSGAQISAGCLAASAVDLPARVCRGDVFRSYPNANRLCTIQCSGAVLRQAMEWTACFLLRQGDGYVIAPEFLQPKARLFHYDFYMGIDYRFDFDLPRGERLVSLEYHGKKVEDSDLFTLCITSYRYAGGDGYDMFRSCPLLWADNVTIAERLADYLEAKDTEI